MKFRLHIPLFALLTTAVLAHAADSTNAWFAGMLTPPRVIPALPTNFIVVSVSPDAKTSKEFDMYEGNVWAPERTARQFEFRAEKKFSNTQDPMFYVRLSSEVGQHPDSDTFTNEKNIESNSANAGLKKVKSAKTKWGDYPVLSLTGERPDGSPVFVAWLGINSRDGWTVLIDYRVPKGKGHPTKEERRIWERFLNDTKPAK
jgi:hypothetical protein